MSSLNPGQERSERLEARITPRQKNLFRRAAEIQGRSVSDFVIQAASETAKQVVHESEEIVLSEQDRAVFVKSLLKPGKPNAALRAAAKRYKQMIRES